MTTVAPLDSPTKKPTRRLIRVLVLPPTAARACFPTNRPTTMEQYGEKEQQQLSEYAPFRNPVLFYNFSLHNPTSPNHILYFR